MFQVHGSRRLAPIPCGPLRCFVTFGGKSQWFSPSSSGKSSYEYFSPHSLFLIQNKVVQEEGKH